TLELANRAICTPDGIAKDVFVPVGKFTFLADFVVVNYESDPRVPLILGRPFLRTARALIDVHGEEMILRDGDERLTLNMKHDTASYSKHLYRESVNLINIFNLSRLYFLSEELPDIDSFNDIHPHFDDEPLSGSTTYSANSLLEEFADELALISYPLDYDDCRACDIESDIREIKFLLFQGEDSNFKDSIDQSVLTHHDDLFVDLTPEIEDCLKDLVSNKQSGNPTFSLHKEIASPEGCTFLSEELPDTDSFNDIHPYFDDDPLSGSTTFSANSLLEEFADELALISYPPDYDDTRACDIESDIREIEFFLFQDEDSDFKDSIDQYVLTHCDDLFVDPIPEMFDDEQTPDYSFPLRFDVYPDDFLEIKSDATFDDDSFDSEGEKIKEAKLLIDPLDLSCDILSEYDSFNSQDFFRDDVLFSPDNKDKVFNPRFPSHEKSVKIITRVTQEKKLAVSYTSWLSEDFDPPFSKLLVFKEVPISMRLLPFSSENEEKVFKPGIYTFKKFHCCFLSDLSHPSFPIFKVNLIFLSLMKIFHVQNGKNTPHLDVLLFYFYPP
nr:reverse transcriptase domain-containing protein [Tanacetum cinerariifolium]